MGTSRFNTDVVLKFWSIYVGVSRDAYSSERSVQFEPGFRR